MTEFQICLLKTMKKSSHSKSVVLPQVIMSRLKVHNISWCVTCRKINSANQCLLSGLGCDHRFPQKPGNIQQSNLNRWKRFIVLRNKHTVSTEDMDTMVPTSLYPLRIQHYNLQSSQFNTTISSRFQRSSTLYAHTNLLSLVCFKTKTTNKKYVNTVPLEVEYRFMQS